MAKYCKLIKCKNLNQIKENQGKQQNQNSAPLEKGEKMITRHNEIEKKIADHCAKISRDPHMKSDPRTYIKRKKTRKSTI